MRSVPIWDLPTRIFHWALAALVLLDLFVAEDDPGISYKIHASGGYALLFLLAFRLPWGLVGSPRSRFADFLHAWPTVRDYSRRLIRLGPPRAIGHNPLGGWMVVVLLGTVFLTALSGLFAGNGRVAGPFVTARHGVFEALGELHEGLANALIPLIVIHLLGVLADWVLTRDNIIWAMITGRKKLDDAEAAREASLAGNRRAVALAALVALAGGLLIAFV